MNTVSERWLRAVRWVLTCCLMLQAPWCWASWTLTTNGEAGFNSPTAYANLRKIDFSTSTPVTAAANNTLSSEQTASRLSYSAPTSASFSEADTSAATGMSGKHVKWVSGTATGYKSMTISFPNGGTSYVAFAWYLGLKDQDGAAVTYNFSDGTSQTLYSCNNSSSSTCLGAYVPGNFLSNLFNLLTLCLLGCNEYDTVYLSYVPTNGVKITSVTLSNGRCDGCGLLWSNTSQNMYVDNISYVDSTVGPHHLEITTGSASVNAGSTITFTVKACADASCSTTFTTGMSGTLTLSGTGLTVTYPSGQTYTIGARSATTTITASVTPAGTATVALSAPSMTPTGSPSVYCGFGVAAASGNSCTLTVIQPLDHLELLSSSADTVACNPVTFTIKACSNSTCSTPYTGGVTGTLAASGTDLVGFSTSFSIAAGSSSTTYSTLLGLSNLAANSATATAALSGTSPTPINAVPVFYGMGAASGTSGGSQSIVVRRAALVFDVPNHAAETTQSISVRAVRADNSTNACTPAFADVDKSVTFKCAYGNPTSGFKAVRVADNTYGTYAALNAGNSAAAACDTGGRALTLRFNSSGVAAANVLYADVGQVTLTATHTDNSLTMSGSDTFVAAPSDFSLAVTTPGNLVAGTNFSGTVTARNALAAATPNFGRELSPESVSIGFARTQPGGTGAVNGTWTVGSIGGFSAGAATSSSLRWTEVGRGDLTATLSDADANGYLGSGHRPSGSSTGTWISCASENGTCSLPTGATATVRYGASGQFAMLTGRTGSVACNNATFGDPVVGVSKACHYIVTAGAHTAYTGAAGPFIPDHFDVSLTPGCGSFTYSGQPFTATVTARNALNDTTLNYAGTGTTTNSHAKAVTLQDTSATPAGTLSNTSMAAASFVAGVGSTSPTYTFSTKPYALTSGVPIRAYNSDGVTSSGAGNGSLMVRSGRLAFSNEFGSEKAPLQVPVQAQYWSDKAWVLNSADSCTTVPASAVAVSGYTNSRGESTTAWTTSASSISLSNGIGVLTLSAPTGGLTGSADVALNLGVSGVDVACAGTHPVTSTPAGLVWLRSRYGNCATTFDRDPSARITFGIYSPESRKTVHVRQIF